MKASAVFVALMLMAGGCSDDSADAIVLYTSVTQATVDTVVDGFRASHPDVVVEVFRAPTGELNARIAAERRDGGLRCDLLWLTDPLSMQQYEAAGLLRAAEPDTSGVPDRFAQDRFWGTRVLNLVVVTNDSAPPIGAWEDLVAAAQEGGVALADPSFAGSAFAAVAYFALDPDLGNAFLQRLHDAGASQVGTPGDVVTGVAEGTFAAGITLDFIARAAVDKGSPIDIVWPDSGAIALFSPIAVTSESGAAVDFVSYVLGVEGQTAIAATGWEPVRMDVAWERRGPQATVAWDQAFDRQEELLTAYRSIFGG